MSLEQRRRGDATTTSELSTILLPTKVPFVLEVLRYMYFAQYIVWKHTELLIVDLIYLRHQ